MNAARLLRTETLTLIAAVLVVAFGVWSNPRFADLGFLLLSATYYAEYGLVALLLTMLIVNGEIDLSVASQIALTACGFAIAVEAGVPAPLAAVGTLGFGMVLGGINALLVVGFGLPALICTIGTLTLYRGLAQVLLGDRSVTRFPEWWYGIDFATVLGLPVSLVIFFAATIVCAVVLHGTVIGRTVFQVGVNPSAARRVGLPVDRTRVGLYVATGLACAVAGLMMSSRLGAVRYDLASGGELQIVVIAVLGGAAITGGAGSIFGAFTAFWLLVVVQTLMILSNIGVEKQLTVIGAMLIAALSFPLLVAAVSRRRAHARAMREVGGTTGGREAKRA